MRVALAFAQYGPYHRARAAALAIALGPARSLVPVQIASSSGLYAWEAGDASMKVETLAEGRTEEVSFLRIFFAACRLFRNQGIDAALLPSYSPAGSFALFAAAKAAGLRTVMMNESHAGTERASGWKRFLKRQIVTRFDSALVGGAPQKRHFVALGLPEKKIFTGYDAVDNAYFATEARKAREQDAELRTRYGLPARYLLNLGRMVGKKNLPLLIRAYAVARKDPGLRDLHLVLVGSGGEEPGLRALAREAGLAVVDHSLAAPAQSAALENGAVHFYGFRQINENPVFYALAEGFVLPSLYEEWGLVVNEAMACGLPVIVSQTAGCAEDLVENGKNGFLFDPTSEESLVEKVRLLFQDAERRAAMSRRSQEVVARWGCENFARNALWAIDAAMGNS